MLYTEAPALSSYALMLFSLDMAIVCGVALRFISFKCDWTCSALIKGIVTNQYMLLPCGLFVYPAL